MQIKEKTGTKTTRAKAIEREVAKNDSNHVPTSVDAYTDAALKGWFEDKDIATGLLLSLNKNRLTSLGSKFTDFKKLGFRDEDALTKAHKSIDLKYLRKLNRMAARLLHDAVFEPSTKVYTAAQTKLNGILRNSEVLKEAEGRARTLRFTQRSSNTLYCRVNVRVDDGERRDSCSSSLINFVLNLSKLFLVNRRMSSS